ncbi:2553_t:CDS:1, partial [Funneliformis geosporum]
RAAVEILTYATVTIKSTSNSIEMEKTKGTKKQGREEFYMEN